MHRDLLAKEVREELSDGEKEALPAVAEAYSKKRQVVESSVPAPPSLFQACLTVRRWSGGQASSDIPHRQQAGGQASSDIPHRQQAGGQASSDIPHRQQAGGQASSDIPHQQQAGGQASSDIPHRQQAGGQASSDIPHRQQEYLIKARFTVPEIAKLVGISVSTIRCRMLEYSLTDRGTYSDISDAELDAEDAKVQKEFPGWGNRQLHGYLQSCVWHSSSGSVCSQLPTLSGQSCVKCAICRRESRYICLIYVSKGKGVLQDWASNGAHGNTN